LVSFDTNLNPGLPGCNFLKISGTATHDLIRSVSGKTMYFV